MNASPPECGTCLQWWETGVLTVWLKWRPVCFMDLGESPRLVEFADVLSRRGTPAYFPEPLLPGAGRGRQGGAGIGGEGPHPPTPCRAPHRMSPLTWMDGNTKPTMTLVSPSTAPSTAKAAARAAGRSRSSPRRARDLGAESAGPGERRGARRAL